MDLEPGDGRSNGERHGTAVRLAGHDTRFSTVAHERGTQMLYLSRLFWGAISLQSRPDAGL